MRKKPLILLLALICIFAAVSISLAVPNYTDRTRNVITTGRVDIEILENGFALKGEITNEGITFSDVVPAMTYSKTVTISNAAEPCWLRVKVHMYVKDPEVGVAYEPEKLVKPNYNQSGLWISGGDGYFYYRDVLKKGAVTDPLFTEVLFAPEIGNEYAEKQIQMQITAQAVQQKNNSADSVLAVQGWPESGGA